MNVEEAGNMVKHCQDWVFDISSQSKLKLVRDREIKPKEWLLRGGPLYFFKGGEGCWAITNWKKITVLFSYIPCSYLNL